MTVAILWVDQKQGKLFLISEEQMKRESFQVTGCDSLAPCTKGHGTEGRSSYPRGEGLSGGISCEAVHSVKFFQKLSLSLKVEKKILIVGPGVAKDDFYQYLKEKEPEIAKKVLGCETLNHSTDEHIAAYAMSHLKAIPHS